MYVGTYRTHSFISIIARLAAGGISNMYICCLPLSVCLSVCTSTNHTYGSVGSLVGCLLLALCGEYGSEFGHVFAPGGLGLWGRVGLEGPETIHTLTGAVHIHLVNVFPQSCLGTLQHGSESSQVAHESRLVHLEMLLRLSCHLSADSEVAAWARVGYAQDDSRRHLVVSSVLRLDNFGYVYRVPGARAVAITLVRLFVYEECSSESIVREIPQIHRRHTATKVTVPVCVEDLIEEHLLLPHVL
mmetsp:Transcript_25158/g.62295  ORF Transcript_25158/g.62295 Transcript_25158/m.62295 type:complete len:244 (-) Transcript_25158:440-1171(-)